MKTVTGITPPVVASMVVISAVNCVVETKDVARFEPFQRTTELTTKLLPFTVNVKATPSTVAEDGFKLLTIGSGIGPNA